MACSVFVSAKPIAVAGAAQDRTVPFESKFWTQPNPNPARNVHTPSVAAATLGVWTFLAGFGFGWVQNLLSNGTVRSWAAPATAIGLALTNTLHAIGFHGVATGSVIGVTRLIGLLVAAGFTLWLLWHAEERGWVRSLALSLILFVELGPVVQPWYLAWGLVLLAVSYKGREHFWLLALSIIGPFIGLPGGRALLADLVHSNPLLIALAVAILGGLLILPMGRWTQWSWPAAELEIESPLVIATE